MKTFLTIAWFVLGVLIIILSFVALMDPMCDPVSRYEYQQQGKRITRLERIAANSDLWPAGEPTPATGP